MYSTPPSTFIFPLHGKLPTLSGKCPNDPKSYRPISLLSITGKIFERILTNRLKFTLETNNLLPPEQFGFRTERSTQNPLAELQTEITRHANLGECTVGVFLDIERATSNSSNLYPPS
jgi:hypothetical protein